jgi:hypothetical protein
MKYKKAALLDPFAKVKAKNGNGNGMKTVVSGSNDFYGANSLETFSSASSLSYTHEDADGFLDYPTSFSGKAANYWRRDSGVQVWAYEETYDNWQDTYGMDAVLVFYHSGHGAMDGNGVFQAPLGARWDNRDWAYSNRMAFGNEELRYLYWSTCFSLRVSGPDSPVRTWWNPNKGGIRMIFGYETTSVDDPNYGKFFWDEWKKGKTFARAFLDASWRISHNQVPVVMAAGTNQTDAINRLNNERFYTTAAAGKGWYQWQWIGTLPNRAMAAPTKVPKQLNALVLDNKFAEDERLSRIANEVGVAKAKAGTILFDAAGNRAIESKDVQLNVDAEGALNIHFGKPNARNMDQIDEEKAIKIAKRSISGLKLDKEVDLTLGNIRHRLTAGGTMEGTGRTLEPSVVETIVQFRQTHNGVESVNSDHGLIAVCIDNDGRVTNLYDTTKLVIREVDKKTYSSSSPRDPKKSKDTSIDRQFQKKIAKVAGPDKKKATTLREKVGYDFATKIGSVVYQKDVEVDFGQGLKKRYKVRVPAA